MRRNFFFFRDYNSSKRLSSESRRPTLGGEVEVVVEKMRAGGTRTSRVDDDGGVSSKKWREKKM